MGKYYTKSKNLWNENIKDESATDLVKITLNFNDENYIKLGEAKYYAYSENNSENTEISKNI